MKAKSYQFERFLEGNFETFWMFDQKKSSSLSNIWGAPPPGKLREIFGCKSKKSSSLSKMLRAPPLTENGALDLPQRVGVRISLIGISQDIFAHLS